MKSLTNNHFIILDKNNSRINYRSILGNDLLQRTLFFTEQTLKDSVEEESKRDSSVIFEREGQSLRTMSSGERKVAFLFFLLSKEPDVLVVESFYENLDSKNKHKLEALLIKFSSYRQIIQLVRKQSEAFEFISEIYLYQDASLLTYTGSISSYFEVSESVFEGFSIPQATTKYNYSYDVFVRLTNVTIKYFEKTILNTINWEIKLGEFWQLIGENGSGKTTLLSLITGDNHKAYGKNIILFDKLKGTEENVWEIKRKIGYFTPNITELFNRRHSVLHMVLSGFYDSIGLYVKPLDIHLKLAKEWIELIGLTKSSNTTFTTLSVAEQRLVLIARAMVKHPPLLILDEPTAGLTVESTKLIVALIHKISSETRTTIIYVSHKLEEDLVPDSIYMLDKSPSGSIGQVLS